MEDGGFSEFGGSLLAQGCDMLEHNTNTHTHTHICTYTHNHTHSSTHIISYHKAFIAAVAATYRALPPHHVMS